MPYNTSGGPSINTGNAAWDQGLGSIFSAFDPSKIAQAGYYGADQRYRQLQSSQLQEQIAAGHQFLGMTTGQMPGRPQYRTDPATGQNILADTAAVWAPPASSAPGSGPTPAPAAPPISSVVTGPAPGPAPGLAPAPAPSFQGGGEGGGAGPAAISNLIADSVSNASTSNAGPPLPQASPPAPSAPPAPNTTTTDGKTPADNGAGILHPGSFTPPGGGVKMSGSAAPDGSPAPVAFNLGQFVALGVMKGMPAADAMTVARGVVTNWVKTGQMDQQHADDMLADLGETAMRVANLNNAGALQRQGMIEEGADRRLPPTFIPDEGHPGSGTFVSPVGGDFRKPGGMRGGSPTPLSTDQNTAALQQQITNEPDPAKRAQLVQRLQQASPRPPPDEKEVYAARAMNYQSDNEAYPTPQKPPVAFHITAPIALRGDAQAAVDRRVQELMDQNRRLDLATAHQQAVYQLQDEGVLYSPDEVTAMRQGTAANLYGRYDAQIQNYAPPGGKPSEHLMIGLKPKGQQGQQQQQPAQTSPPPTATTTPPPPSPAATPPGPPYRPMQDIFGGSGGSSGAPPVPFWQSYLNRPAASGPAPLTTQQMYGGVSTVPAAPAASTPAANQPIGKAAPNAQEGSIAYLNGRPVGIVRGGAVYPMPAETGPGGGG